MNFDMITCARGFRGFLAAGCAAAVFTIVSAAGTASAATVVIDDFSATQSVYFSGRDTMSDSVVADPNIIGGYRELFLQTNAATIRGSGPTGADVGEAASIGRGVDLSNGPGYKGSVTATYDGYKDPNGGNYKAPGFSGVDLTSAGTNDQFSLTNVDSDGHAFNLVLTVWSGAGSATYAHTYDASSDIAILFTAFAGVDLTHVTGLSLTLGSLATNNLLATANGLDMHVGRFEAVDSPVPLPASVALFGSALGLMGLLARRRRPTFA